MDMVWTTSSVTVGRIRLTGKRAKRRLLQTFARSHVPIQGAAVRATVPRASRCTVPITSSRSYAREQADLPAEQPSSCQGARLP